MPLCLPLKSLLSCPPTFSAPLSFIARNEAPFIQSRYYGLLWGQQQQRRERVAMGARLQQPSTLEHSIVRQQKAVAAAADADEQPGARGAVWWWAIMIVPSYKAKAVLKMGLWLLLLSLLFCAACVAMLSGWGGCACSLEGAWAHAGQSELLQVLCVP
ncbi:unnamed protein product [Closterium sp. Naga37s-1]|nr:unnamed protein product [Closterium sp. Naga37s-1]